MDIGKLDLQFIHDPLVTGLADATATNKGRVSDDGISDELTPKDVLNSSTLLATLYA